MAIILGLVSVAIAGVAAYFSVVGLVQLFAAAIIPVMVMGIVLEIGKLVTTAWLHIHWHDSPKILKYPLTTMVVILMVITSMGIFGFLSAGHLEQKTPATDVAMKIERLDLKISQSKNNMTALDSRLVLLDDAVKKAIDGGFVKNAEKYRADQQSERKTIRALIDEENKIIDGLLDEKLVLQQENSKIEAKLGPVKYVAEMFNLGNDTGKAVRLVILLLMIAFDPLAILLVIATTHTLSAHRAKIVKIGTSVPTESEPQPSVIEPNAVSSSQQILETKIDVSEDNVLSVEKNYWTNIIGEFMVWSKADIQYPYMAQTMSYQWFDSKTQETDEERPEETERMTEVDEIDETRLDDTSKNDDDFIEEIDPDVVNMLKDNPEFIEDIKDVLSKEDSPMARKLTAALNNISKPHSGWLD